jgi:hypothetical protein
MKASVAVSDYTPATGIPFGRLGVNRLVPTGVHSPLTARLALFADDHGMSGVLSLPQNRVRRLVARELRAVLAEATGAEPEAFAIAATHTHNAPILVPWRTDDPSFSVLDRLREHVLRLGREAVAGLRPVSLAEGHVRVPGLAGCRRPVYRADDGREQVGTHGPRSGSDLLRMESPDEDELRVLFVLDETGTVCGGIVKFSCHPTTMYAESLISADYPGDLCDWLAWEILGLWEVKRRSEVRQITEEAEIQLLTAGSAALLTLPCEPFSAIGQALRARHPDLLIAEQCNGHCGYIPLDPTAFDRGGYECCTAQQSRLVPLAGKEMLNAAEDLLLVRSSV